MKVIQVRNLFQPNDWKLPKLLKSGRDFHDIHFRNGETWLIKTENNKASKRICQLSDCWQGRPLIEIDGFCEFDVYDVFTHDLEEIFFSNMVYPIDTERYNLYEHVQHLKSDPERIVKKGFILLFKNQEKYVKLSRNALEIINQ